MRAHRIVVATCLAIGIAASAKGVLALPVEEETRRLQAAAPPPPKSTFSLWSAAKRFFQSREKTKAKLSGNPSPPTPLAMSAKYGVSYKAMLAWICAKPEWKAKNLCRLHEQGKAEAELAKSTTEESKEALKVYCKEPAFKSKLICIVSAFKSKQAAGVLTSPVGGGASSSARPNAHSPGKSAFGAKPLSKPKPAVPVPV